MMKRNAAALLAASILASPAVVFAMAGSNTVNSAAIVDGEVKSSDLGYQAVTSSKIATSAVSDAKISDVGMGKVTGLATALAAKADQAGVDAALAGKADQASVDAALATKIDQATLDAALAAKADQATVNAALAAKADVNHAHLLGNMTVVATEGGEYTSPAAAMSDVANWCGAPSASNPCLVKVMPGVYDLGSDYIPLVSNVSIAGSGAAVTKITSTADWGTIRDGQGVVANVAIDDLTVENRSAYDGGFAPAVALEGGSAIEISRCTLLSNPIGTLGAAVKLMNHNSLKLADSTLKSTGSVYAIGLMNYYSPSLVVTNTTIDVATTDASYANAYGILNYDHDPSNQDSVLELHGVKIMANSAVNARGINAESYAGKHAVRFNDVNITTVGGNLSYGVYFAGSYEVSLNGVTALASGTENSAGLAGGLKYSVGGTIDAMNSSFSGEINSIVNATTMHLASSKVAGAISNNGGTLKCSGVVDSNFDPVTCP